MLQETCQINNNKGQCVLDMIMHEYTNKTYTRCDLIKELEELAEENEKKFLTEGITTNLIMKWAKHKKYVSCWALDPFGVVFSNVCAVYRTIICLVFVVNNNYVYPITNPTLKESITKVKRIKFNNMSIQIR